MNGETTHPGLAWRRGRRVLLVLIGGVLFLGVASVIKPSPRGAAAAEGGSNNPEFKIELRKAFVHPGDANSTNPNGMESAKLPTARQAVAEATHPKGWKLIGTLEGREHMLRCWATPDGPRYSVHTLNGRLIQDELPADEVYRGFPDLDLSNLRADPPSDRGMLVDFVDVWRE